MQSEIWATILFWAAFVISAGPFWTATMAAATTTTFKKLYADYILYLIFGWIPLVAFISVLVAQLGAMGPRFNILMHFVGVLVVFWMAWKIYRSKPGASSDFDFNWKAMSLLSWSNPKVWLLVPVGFLSAGMTDNIYVNIALYIMIGIPFFLVGVFVWGSIGRIGAKISLKYVNKFNALLMFLFGCYLLFEGWNLLEVQVD